MNSRSKFIYSELVPLEGPFILEIHNFKSDSKDWNDQRQLSWEVYERGKLKTVTMPNPGAFIDLHNKWLKIEKDIFASFLKWETSITQLPIARDKNNKKLNKKYFEYKNQRSYSEFLKEIQKQMKSKKNFYLSVFDLQNFFGQINIDYFSTDKKIWKFLERLTLGKNGLPVGPNISRIMCQLIGFEIDKAFVNFFSQKGLGNCKIYRYIDDYYVLHQKPLVDISILEQTIMRINMRFNYNKMKLNLSEFNKEELNWDQELQKLTPNSLQAAIKKLVRFSRRTSSHLDDSYCIDFYERLTKYFNIFINETLRSGINALKMWKASNSSVLLKAYLAIKNRNTVWDRKVRAYLDELVIATWELILNDYYDNAAILNTYASFIPIISLADEKENKQIIARLKKLSVENMRVFPVVCALFSIAPEKSLDLLHAHYGLTPKKGKEIVASDEDIRNRINSAYQYW